MLERNRFATLLDHAIDGVEDRLRIIVGEDVGHREIGVALRVATVTGATIAAS